MANKQEIKEYLNDILTMECKFIGMPTHNVKFNDWRLCWLVRLTNKRNKSLLVEYFEGIGHIPNFKHSLGLTNREYEQIRKVVEKGRYFPNKESVFDKKLPNPDLVDVVYCLVMDSSVLDNPCFDDWCADYGYNNDSIKDKAIFEKCLFQACRFREIIGDKALNDLRELYQDY